jgi:hypothetical protein
MTEEERLACSDPRAMTGYLPSRNVMFYIWERLE